MQIIVSERARVSALDALRIATDMGYMLPIIDADVVSVTRLTPGPLGIGTRWQERIRVPLLPFLSVTAELEITGFTPGRSVLWSFRSALLSGSGETSCVEDGEFATISVNMTARPTRIGLLLFPIIRMDLARRERKRITAFREKIESGELDPEQAEPPITVT